MQLRPHQAEALDVMDQKSKGIVVVPTGGGKTFIAVADAMREMGKMEGCKTIVVVAPRLLLARQLSNEFTQHIKNAAVLHVHSGGHDLPYHCTTDPSMISKWDYHTTCHKLIFTTYHSLHRIQESKIVVDCIYFDEAHNSVKKNFFGAARHYTSAARRCYFFTATPKYSATLKKHGMNDSAYGGIIYNVPAPRLIQNGSILPPKINAITIPAVREKNVDEAALRDCMTLLRTIRTEDHMDKVLIAAPNTTVLGNMIIKTNFLQEAREMGYDILWITSRQGAYKNYNKISREKFFALVNEYGKQPDKKFIVIHYSILSEGISVPGLTSLVLMRQMNVIEMCQSVGRVLRLHLDDIKRIEDGELTPGNLGDYKKSFGLVHVPVYSNVGISTVKRLQDVVNTVFVEGQPAISTVKR